MFKEAGDNSENTRSGGLPKMWHRLEDNECPACGDELELFTHLDLWKCPCGFKISDVRKREIQDSRDERMYGRGFGCGNWHDDTPF